jgi:hypothetical protein
MRGGNFRETAARYAGVPPETLSRWLARDGQFRQAVLEAEQAAEILAVAYIRKAGETDPKHFEWWLERKFPERWGRRERIDMDVSVRQRAEQIAHGEGLDVDELLAEAQRLVSRYG